jgi:hypothetical protein
MYQTHIFLDEAGRILNEKMMPDLTVMVPKLTERYRKSIFLRKNVLVPERLLGGRGAGGVSTRIKTRQ